MIYLMDIGHSRIKVAEYVREGEIGQVRPIDLKGNWVEAVLNCFVAPHKFFIASVNSEAEKKLLAHLPEDKLFLVTSKDVPMPTNYDRTKLGIDRLLACYGAWKIYRCDLVVIDAGSLITVDWVSEGRHLGGLILPGIRMLCEQYYSYFPWVDRGGLLAKEVEGIACSTEEAIKQGLEKIYSFLSEIQELIVLTGGDVNCLEQLLLRKTRREKQEHLVLRGLSFLPILIREKDWKSCKIILKSKEK